MGRFVSTRGGAPVPFRSAVLDGLARDGGLYLPEHIPAIPWNELRSLSSPAVVAARMLAPFVPYGSHEIAAMTNAALPFDMPLVSLTGNGWKRTWVLELFHGPTASFKDVGARCLAQFLATELAPTSSTVRIVVATSGDTGSAVADAFAGHASVSVTLLYPRGVVSPVQEAQLTQQRPGVRVYRVDGTFDDCQSLAKAAFAKANRDYMPLTSANSINVGRLLPQMSYYAWALCQLGSERPVVVVPSGNLGNLTAGVLALKIGVPIRQFVAAHNANDWFPRALQRGMSDAFGEDASGKVPVVRTLSNAMDVGRPSNAERLGALMRPAELRRAIVATTVDDDATTATMRDVFDATGYVADPHTAVALEAARRYRFDGGYDGDIVVLATAHPAKYPEVVSPVIRQEVPTTVALSRLRGASSRVEIIAPTLDALIAAGGLG